MVRYMKLNFILTLVFLLVMFGCGKKADPLPPASQNIVAK